MCSDINECETGDFECDDNAECINTEGSYECNCNNGYEGDGKNCFDVNECDKGRVVKWAENQIVLVAKSQLRKVAKNCEFPILNLKITQKPEFSNEWI